MQLPCCGYNGEKCEHGFYRTTKEKSGARREGVSSLGLRDPCQVPREVGVRVPKGHGVPLV